MCSAYEETLHTYHNNFNSYKLTQEKLQNDAADLVKQIFLNFQEKRKKKKMVFVFN